MTAPLASVLGDTATYLQRLAHDSTRPEQAEIQLQDLKQQYPDTRLDLVWVEEAFDRSVHYDALVHQPGEGTLSLSFSSERGLPWPLRGVQRWNDKDLVRVNDFVLTVDHAIACLDFVWDEAPIVQRLVDVCLIQEELKQHPISLSEAELQQAMDAFRRARRLYTAHDTRRWMSDKGITFAKLERLVADEATLARLRAQVIGDRVDAYFEAHRDDFTSVFALRAEFHDEIHARAALDEIAAGTDFDALIRERVAEAAARGDAPPTVQSVVLRRRDAIDLEPLEGAGSIRAGTCPISKGPPPDLTSVLFTAGPGDVVGPLRAERGAALLSVLPLAPPTLDHPTREAIGRLLFDAWLDERRRSARIEWFWGTAA